MMKCGHAANATSEGAPCCAICIGIRPGATQAADAEPDLAGRTATCLGHRPVPSQTSLPFFEHRPGQPTDDYYCGHGGWE